MPAISILKITRHRHAAYGTYLEQRDSADAVSARPGAVEDDVDKLLLTQTCRSGAEGKGFEPLRSLHP